MLSGSPSLSAKTFQAVAFSTGVAAPMLLPALIIRVMISRARVTYWRAEDRAEMALVSTQYQCFAMTRTA
jgi:hypothetical protein